MTTSNYFLTIGNRSLHFFKKIKKGSSSKGKLLFKLKVIISKLSIYFQFQFQFQYAWHMRCICTNIQKAYGKHMLKVFFVLFFLFSYFKFKFLYNKPIFRYFTKQIQTTFYG